MGISIFPATQKMTPDQLLSQQPEPKITNFIKKFWQLLGVELPLTGSTNEIIRLLDRAVVDLSTKKFADSTQCTRLFASVKMRARQINPSVTDRETAKLFKELIDKVAIQHLHKERQIVVFKEIDKQFQIGLIPEHATQLKAIAAVAACALAASVLLYILSNSTNEGFTPDTNPNGGDKPTPIPTPVQPQAQTTPPPAPSEQAQAKPSSESSASHDIKNNSTVTLPETKQQQQANSEAPKKNNR